MQPSMIPFPFQFSSFLLVTAVLTITMFGPTLVFKTFDSAKFANLVHKWGWKAGSNQTRTREDYMQDPEWSTEQGK
jgi:hypothetical protein